MTGRFVIMDSEKRYEATSPVAALGWVGLVGHLRPRIPTTMQPLQNIGPYAIVRKIGAGGMGEVFEAIHSLIDRRVAIKVLHPEFAQRPDIVARFFNEARAVNRIAHPGLVQISDYGQLADQSAYIVMEFLNGETLSKRILRGTSALPVGMTLNFAFQLADSLAAAHAKDVIHRDLKPDNVMIIAESQAPGGERAKLLDFGIAKVVVDGGETAVRTRTGAIMGTPYYMSPEQCRGAGQVDGRTDTYSLGVMLYEMLSGERPIPGHSHAELIANHLVVEPVPLASKMPRLPRAVAELVGRMLCKNRDQRPPMAKVAAALHVLSAEHPPPPKQRTTANVAVLPPSPKVAADAPAPPPAPLAAATTVPPPADRPPEAAKLLDSPDSGAATASTVLTPDGMPGPLVRGAQLPQPTVPARRRLAVTLVELAARRRHRPALAAGLLGAVLALGTLTARCVRRPREWPVASSVQLRVHTTPPGADIVQVRDGTRLGCTPWQVQRPVGTALLKLRLHLSGYVDKELVLDLSHDNAHDIVLQAETAPPSPELPDGETPRKRKIHGHGTAAAGAGTSEDPADGPKNHRRKVASKSQKSAKPRHSPP